MPKKDIVTIETALAVLHEKMDAMLSVLNEHIKSSDEYRTRTTNLCNDVRWHRKWLYLVSCGVLIALSLVAGINLMGN